MYFPEKLRGSGGRAPAYVIIYGNPLFHHKVLLIRVIHGQPLSFIMWIVVDGNNAMKSERSGMQRFYIESRVVELVLTYQQACILMGAVSSKLQVAAVGNLDITIPLSITAYEEESTLYEGVICKRVVCPIEVALSSKEYSRFEQNEVDSLDMIQDYFNA